MNKIKVKKVAALSILGVTLMLQGCSEKIDARQTSTIQGLIYKIHDKEPFTGTMINYQMSVADVLMLGTCDFEVKKGLPDGLATCKSNEGTKIAEIEFVAGKKSGIEKKWDAKSGNLISKTEWLEGRQQGLEEKYSPENEKLISTANWSNGQKSGEEKAWDATGEILLVDLTWANGKQTGFTKIGDDEKNYKDGKLHGVQKRYGINSKTQKYFLFSEEHYEGNTPVGKHSKVNEDGKTLSEVIYKNGIIMSSLEQTWHDEKMLSRVYKINVSLGITDPYEAKEALVKDGKEFLINGSGNLEFEIDWEKGKPIKGILQSWRGSQLVTTFNGVTDSEGKWLVKDGLEKIWGEYGQLSKEIKWDKGNPVSVVDYTNINGKIDRFERTHNLNPNSEEFSFNRFPI